jgi:hypothetical protein
MPEAWAGAGTGSATTLPIFTRIVVICGDFT